MDNDALRVLADGKVFVDYGPVSMVIMARNPSSMMTELALESFAVIHQGLEDLAVALPFLRRYPDQLDADAFSGLARRMIQAVQAVEEPTLTPMATVAGAMSDLVADWLQAQGAPIVAVNNGGDIALRLAEAESIRMGILSDIRSTQMDEIAVIYGSDRIGGVCTSGLGGRSLTRGIASAVTVFSERCIQADACATHIANCSYVESPRVKTVRAGELDPGSDIADLTVVTEVGVLTAEEIRQGLAGMQAECIRQSKLGNLLRMAADIQGSKVHFSGNK